MNGAINYRIDLWAVFIFLGIVQGLFLSIFFLSKSNRGVQSNVFHGFLLIAISGCLLEIFLMYTGYIVHCFYLVDFSESLSLLIGPLTFLMLSSIIQGSVPRNYYLHLLPFVFYSLYLSMFIALPDDAKYNAWLGSYHPEWPRREFHYPYDADPFGIRRNITLTTIVSIFGYGIFSLVKTYTVFKKKTESFFSPKTKALRTLRWHVFLLISSAIFILIVKIVNPADTGDHVFATYIAVTIYMTSFYVMQYSGFFRQTLANEQQKYRTSSITAEQAQITLMKLREVMKNEKPFLQSSFSLPDLAERLSVSVHGLSQMINESLNKSFFELTAEYRVEEAKKLLKEKSYMKVEEIAEQVGYNSKSSFNTVFKKLTGKTPSEYRAD